MDYERQQHAPIYEALERFRKKRVVPFDVPGHKRGRGNPELAQLLGEKCVGLDVNSMKPLDNLCHPVSVIREAEELAADAFGAAHAFLMVGGTTSAVQSMILSVCKAGDKIILPRNVHKSAINALVLCGAIPVYVNPEVNAQLGISLGMEVSQVEKAMDENPDAVAVLVNNPTYYGICSDLRTIVKKAHARGMKVLADEAHGTHLYFGRNLPVSENASDYDTAAELPGGNIDYGIYEEYGLIYDKNSKCYTYKGNVVRFFNDPVGGASFTNFFTGTVDIEAERDTNDKLIGIRECTKEVYDRHTEKYENSGLKSMPAGTSTENGDMIRNHESYSMESGDKTENMNTLQDYESYGIVYHPKDGYWYYNDQIIGIFIDTKKPIIYFNNSGSIYLSIAENSENGVMEIKEISEAEAQKLLRDNNSGNSASFTVETLK